MSDSVFIDKFDMAAYIRKRALEIGDLEERALYKEVAEDLVLKIYQKNQEALEQLEQRVFDEIEVRESDYSVYMGLIERDQYDATDPFLFPIYPEDIGGDEVSAADMISALEKGQKYPLYSVYVQAGYQALKEFGAPDRSYYGIVKTTQGEYRAVFTVKKDLGYLQKLQELYQSFITNDIPWTTLCTAHLQKRFLVEIATVENFDKKAEIREVVVDFEEFADQIRYHMVPLWNIETLEEKSSTYPVPCQDKVNQEHRIYAHRLEADCPYLVANPVTEAVHVHRLNGDLVIIGPMTMPHIWKLYKFNRCPSNMDYEYPLLSNQRRQSFTDRLSKLYWKQTKSRAEISRMIDGFYFEKYLVYQGMELKARGAENQAYDMDDFISAEIDSGQRKELMCLFFSPVDPECYLNYDVMSFLVTQVQAVFPEYFCIGRLV